jgi:hypothetical protein
MHTNAGASTITGRYKITPPAPNAVGLMPQTEVATRNHTLTKAKRVTGILAGLSVVVE